MGRPASAASRMAALLDGLARGERRSIARAISVAEDDPAGTARMLKSIFKETGRSVVVGITGPAGAGKSSLINGLVAEMRSLGMRPAVLAIDPTSHVTGGAILGDRVRMTEATDSGAYIRSIASRGSAGAVSRSVRNSIRVLEYAGFDPVVIESVGAGQTEVEISNVADITAVVFSPQTGDVIQAVKAGLTEIGDLYLVNKSDLDGAAQLRDALADFAGPASRGAAGEKGGGGRATVLMTSARSGSGVAELARHLKGMMGGARAAKAAREGDRLEAEMRDIILNIITERARSVLDEGGGPYEAQLRRLRARKVDPYEAARRVAAGMGAV